MLNINCIRRLNINAASHKNCLAWLHTEQEKCIHLFSFISSPRATWKKSCMISATTMWRGHTRILGSSNQSIAITKARRRQNSSFWAIQHRFEMAPKGALAFTSQIMTLRITGRGHFVLLEAKRWAGGRLHTSFACFPSTSSGEAPSICTLYRNSILWRHMTNSGSWHWICLHHLTETCSSSFRSLLNFDW